jgi:hypothetical protein
MALIARLDLHHGSQSLFFNGPHCQYGFLLPRSTRLPQRIQPDVLRGCCHSTLVCKRQYLWGSVRLLS